MINYVHARDVLNMVKKKLAFEWDKFNTVKNWIKHQVRPYEVEEAFTDKNTYQVNDNIHSEIEFRYIILGKTKKHRLLFISFTIREGRIRPISCRDTNKKEVSIYEEKINSTKI